jgi:hypothetical protein
MAVADDGSEPFSNLRAALSHVTRNRVGGRHCAGIAVQWGTNPTAHGGTQHTGWQAVQCRSVAETHTCWSARNSPHEASCPRACNQVTL